MLLFMFTQLLRTKLSLTFHQSMSRSVGHPFVIMAILNINML